MFQSVSSCFSYFVAFQYLREISVNLFLPNVPILYPLKKDFLTFSGAIEIEHWDKIGQIGDRNKKKTKKQSKTKQNWNTFPRKRYEILKKLIIEIFDTSIRNDKPLQIILLVSLLFHTIIANLSLKQRNLSHKISFRSLLYVENTLSCHSLN